MSHEGIRFVSENEARKAKDEAVELSKEAIDPVAVRVFKTEGTGMEIDWKDGHHSKWSFAWLRLGCPCATCNEERKANGLEPGEAKPQAANLLPMYQAPPRPELVTPVGRYAVSFNWNDGHTSGIYSWEYLRRVCQCDECKAGRKG